MKLVAALAAGAAASLAAVIILAVPASAGAGTAYHRPADCESGSFVTDGHHSLNYYGSIQPGVTDMTLLYWAGKCSRSGFWPVNLGLYVDKGNDSAPLPKMRLWDIVFPWWPPPGQ